MTRVTIQFEFNEHDYGLLEHSEETLRQQVDEILSDWPNWLKARHERPEPKILVEKDPQADMDDKALEEMAGEMAKQDDDDQYGYEDDGDKC